MWSLQESTVSRPRTVASSKSAGAPGFHGGHEDRSAEGVKIGERVFPSPLGDGRGEGAMPPPQKIFFDFLYLKPVIFGAFGTLFFTVCLHV